jgi:hypothetical protein
MIPGRTGRVPRGSLLTVTVANEDFRLRTEAFPTMFLLTKPRELFAMGARLDAQNWFPTGSFERLTAAINFRCHLG